MPRYDLNGNELPDDPVATATAAPASAAPAQQYDLAGNPLPQPQASQAPPRHQPSHTETLQAQRKSATYFDGTRFRFTEEPVEKVSTMGAKLAIGSVVALAVSIMGSIGIMKISFYVGIGFTLLYLGLGWLVSYVANLAVSNKFAALGMAVAVLVIGLFVGHITFTADAMHKYPDIFNGETVMDAFPKVMAIFSPTHWVFVLTSFVGCIRAVAHNDD